MRWVVYARIILAFALFDRTDTQGGDDPHRWFATQTLPERILRVAHPPALPLQNLLQSVAGLAAKGVNEGRCREMVWVDNGNQDMNAWLAGFLAASPQVSIGSSLSVWQLVGHFAAQGAIQGYILYTLDKGDGTDCSVNVATSLAGLLNGVIIDESLEQEARRHHLRLLVDARHMTEAGCFERYKEQFSRRILCAQDPRKMNVRDLAIAQKAFTVYGSDDSLPRILAWLEPLSPVLGSMSGDEFQSTDLASRNGDFQTATDWCLNLPVLMAGTEHWKVPKLKALNPKTIQWKDRRSAVCFVGTDGDNVQWIEGNFFRENKFYWGNPERGKIPYGWPLCVAQLAQLCPEAIDYAAATQTTNDCVIEWGGGYYYPDHFGADRTNRWQLLTEQARRTWGFMKRANARLIGFNFAEFNSADARKACEVFAAQTDGLLGILAFQYAPYEGGAGERFWVKDKNGLEVPVVSARYCIWEHSNSRERSGTPAKVARVIRQSVQNVPTPDLPADDWVICHAWSFFQKSHDGDEDAENMPQDNAEEKGGQRGYSPVVWCAQHLPSNIRVVGPEELFWRIRMSHNPRETTQFMRTMAP